MPADFIASKIADPTWAPYCLMCSTMGRMTRTPLGWKCEGLGDHFGRAGCGNQIGPDLCALPIKPTTPKFLNAAYVQSFAA